MAVQNGFDTLWAVRYNLLTPGLAPAVPGKEELPAIPIETVSFRSWSFARLAFWTKL
jgi:hypothetical protein